MSVTVEWRCDICNESSSKGNDFLAVHFENMKKFHLIKCGQTGFGDHKGVHICKLCLSQLQAAPKYCGQKFECTGGPQCKSDHK